MCVKLGLCVTWRNPELGTSMAIMQQRTVSTDRSTTDPPPSLRGGGGGCLPSTFLHPSPNQSNTFPYSFLLEPQLEREESPTLSCQLSPLRTLSNQGGGRRSHSGTGVPRGPSTTRGGASWALRDTTFQVCPVLTPIPSPVPGSPPHPPQVTSASPSTTVSAPDGDTTVDPRQDTGTVHFLHIAWMPIPPSWQPSFVEGKLKVSSPDTSHPSGFRMRIDILIKISTDDEGETTILYKRKPSSVLQPSVQKVSTATLVDTAPTIHRNLTKWGGMSGLTLPEQYFFPFPITNTSHHGSPSPQERRCLPAPPSTQQQQQRSTGPQQRQAQVPMKVLHWIACRAGLPLGQEGVGWPGSCTTACPGHG
ncbi:hypothetical protein Pcinc_005548 [Petrolisthes cinctipes]|uniref:Uncharacterized protein n=1 Tax=Petrolisthes cinctipes TaxID=88211 RepID=A0AAE1L001_PETCI|nr:hypothetical protein Pcinc_005548 [Petrolisthes cinctipes]